MSDVRKIEKLTKKNLYYLSISLMLYILTIQYKIDNMLISNYQMIQQDSIFANVSTFILVLKIIIITISILFLFLQSFIYRLILLLLKIDRYPSMLKNFLFILYSLIPYSVLIILIENFGLKIKFESPYLFLFKVISATFIYVIVLYYNKFIEKNKLLPLSLFLLIIEVLSNSNYIVDLFM